MKGPWVRGHEAPASFALWQIQLCCQQRWRTLQRSSGLSTQSGAGPSWWSTELPEMATPWLATGLAAVANSSTMIWLFTIITTASLVTYTIIMKISLRSNSATHRNVEKQEGTNAYNLLWDLGDIPAPFCAWKVTPRPTWQYSDDREQSDSGTRILH